MSRATMLALALAAVVGAARAAPGLGFDWNPDDVFVVGGVDGTSPWSNRGLDAWSFVKAEDRDRLVEEGALPWWTARDFKYELWRPLSSAILSASHAIFGTARWGHQLVVAIWYLLFLLAVGALYFLTLPRATAMVCLAIFTLASSHLEILYWLAAIHYLVAGTLCAASLALRIRWREAGGRWRLAASYAALLAGLLASEAAFAAAGFLVAWELARGRVRAALGPVLVCVAYLALYKLAGKGIAGEGWHVDPFEHPLAMLQAAARNTALYLVTLFGAGLDWRLLPAAVLVVGLGVRLVRGPAADRERIAFYALGTLLALLPFAANEYSYRTLVLPSLGASALVGIFLTHCARARRLLPAAALALVVAQQGIAHARASGEIYRKRSGHGWSRLHPFLLASAPALAGKRVFVVGGGDFLFGQLGGDYVRRLTGHAPRAWYALSCGDGDHQLTRLDAHTLELTLPSHSRFFRSDLDPMRDGEVIDTGAYAVTVLATDQGHPRRVRIDLHTPLDADALFITLVPTADAPDGQILSLPAIGETTTIVQAR